MWNTRSAKPDKEKKKRELPPRVPGGDEIGIAFVSSKAKKKKAKSAGGTLRPGRGRRNEIPASDTRKESKKTQHKKLEDSPYRGPHA